MATVSVRDLSIRFGALDVLDRLNLDVGAGDFLVLLGPSGCGKSTLLNAIAGLIDVTSGAVLIGGDDVTWKEPKDRGIAMVFQSYALYPRMTVRRNLSFGLRVAGLPAAEIDRRVNAAAEMLKITDLLDRRPAQISGGQRQRVAIGRALVREVGVFLLDEPLSNLDAQLRAELRVELKRLHRRLGSTMIYVTHDQIEALTLADRIAVMKDRVIQQLGTPDEIYNRPANRFVAGFVGSPSMNFLSGRLEQRSGAWAFVGDDAVVPIDGAGIATRPEAGRPVTLGIRPEHIVIDGATPGALGARVEMVEPMGADTLTWAQLGRTALALRLDGDARPALDQPLPLRFPAERLSLFDAATGARL